MYDITEYSGNIKLRLPKSLHSALVYQAELEGISLNQLCVAYLSSSLSSKNLGTEHFNHRLEMIELDCRNDEDLLFKKLEQLNGEVDALKLPLLKEIKEILNNNKRSFNEQIEILRYIYPIYHGDLLGQKLPFLKIPSAKIVLRPVNNHHIDSKEIESIVNSVSPYVIVSTGDYDYFSPIERRLDDRVRMISTVINICCPFEELHTVINNIKSILLSSSHSKKFNIQVKPCYLQLSTAPLFKEKYPEVNYF